MKTGIRIAWIVSPIMAAVVIAGTLGGCRENPSDSNGSAVEDLAAAGDNAAIESEFTNVFEFVDDAALAAGTFGKPAGPSELSPDCAVVTVDSIARTLRIDFGADRNCLCKDGLYRRGAILAEFDGEYGQVGSSVTITLENYVVQNIEMAGTKTVTRTGEASWSAKVIGGMLMMSDGKTIEWSSDRSVTRTEGNGTPTPWDDVYEYTGSAAGTNRFGVDYTVTVDEPLIKKIRPGCFRTFVSGRLTLTSQNGNVLTVDYDPIGDAPCDRTGEVTINGKTYPVTFR